MCEVIVKMFALFERKNLSISFVLISNFKVGRTCKPTEKESTFLFEHITRTCEMIDMNGLEQLIISMDWNNGQNIEWKNN